MDWFGNRLREQYIYKRVSWSDWTEHEAYGYITSGSVELSADSNLKVTGSFAFEGYEIPDTNDLVRVYYTFLDSKGERAMEPIATFFVSYANVSHTDTRAGIKSKGTLNGESVLSVLEDTKYGQPYTVLRNTNMIYKAQELVRELGLPVNFTPSTRAMTADHTFAAGATYLEMVNWLCETAGYTDAYPDPYGTVQLQPYRDTELRSDSIIFRNDDRSIMYPEIEETNNIANIPNVVRLLYNTDIACIRAEARNVTGSRASLDARGGREKTYFEEIGELSAEGGRLASLMDLSEQKLREESCDVEYVTFSHAYVPVYIYDPVTVYYSDREWTGNADNISINLAPATKTQMKIKRVLYDEIVVEKSGAVIRGE